MVRLAVFASGKGSNAINLINYFRNHPLIEIAMILSNNPDAEVLRSAQEAGTETFVIHRKQFYESMQVVDFLREEKIDFIILAGFLWLVPQNLLNSYHQRILNIHPALLPKHGGRGMYGSRVHHAVLASGEKESGITVHLVNEAYDEGEILFSKSLPVEENETAASLAEKIHVLEHEYYPKVIEQYVAGFGN